MQYLHHPEAGAPHITLEAESFRYLIKVRRHRAGEEVALRSGEGEHIHHYTIDSIDRRRAALTLLRSETLPVTARRALHIGWCLIDPKSIEKVLPTLNEIGVARITFIDCERSQHSFRLDTERLHKILLNSSQQCGRSESMRLDHSESIAVFLTEHPEAHLLHFSEHHLSDDTPIQTIVIGCEGGFTDDEVALFAPEQTVGLDTPMILRSESAAVAVASRVVL
jgi:16S rRNA (uracil1498-N3)-methyltransferase